MSSFLIAVLLFFQFINKLIINRIENRYLIKYIYSPLADQILFAIIIVNRIEINILINI